MISAQNWTCVLYLFILNADKVVKSTFCKTHSLTIKNAQIIKNTHFLPWRSSRTLWPWHSLLHRKALILNKLHSDFCTFLNKFVINFIVHLCSWSPLLSWRTRLTLGSLKSRKRTTRMRTRTRIFNVDVFVLHCSFFLVHSTIAVIMNI